MLLSYRIKEVPALAEDEKKSPKKTSGATQPKKAANNEAEQAAPAVALQWAIGLVIAALIVGMGIGYTIAPKTDGAPATSAPSGTSAPALSPDQLKGGQLPAGHPALPPAGTDTSTTGATTQTPAPTK